MYKKIFGFFYIFILLFVLPNFSFAYVGGDGMDKHTTGVQIGGLLDSEPTTEETRFMLLASNSSQCVSVGEQVVDFKLANNFFTNFNIDHYDISYSCVERQEFFGADDSADGFLPENILTAPEKIIGNFKTHKISWNIPASLSGKICKLWLTPMPVHEGRYIYTRPFQICLSGGAGAVGENVSVKFLNWEADGQGRGTVINYLVSGLQARQSVDFVLELFNTDKQKMENVIGVLTSRNNGASRVLIPQYWLSAESSIAISARVITINETSKDYALSKTPPKTPDKPQAVSFSNLTCKTQSNGAISVSGKLASVANTPMSAWIVRYDASLKGQSPAQIISAKNTKTAGFKSNLKVPTTLATNLSNLKGQYCFGLNAQGANKKYSPYFPATPVCCTAAKGPVKKGGPISYVKKYINGFFVRYAIIDTSGNAHQIGVQLVKNRLFTDIVRADVAYSNQTSLVRAAGATAAVAGPFFSQGVGWRQWAINATLVKDGKLIRLMNGGTQICQTYDGDIMFGRFRVNFRGEATNGNNKHAFIISNVNALPEGNAIIAYTKEAFPNFNEDGWGFQTPSNYGSKVAVVRDGRIISVSNGPITPSGDYDYAIVFFGTEQKRFDKTAYPKNYLAAGQSINFSYAALNNIGNDVDVQKWGRECKTIIGGMHTVYYNGRLINGAANFDRISLDAYPKEVKTLRTILATDGGNKVYFITIEDSVPISAEVAILKAIGVKNAVNMDGGTSSFFYFNGNMFNSFTDRDTVPSILYAK